MLYKRYARCKKKECKVCKDGPAHGPYIHANTFEDGKVRNMYLGMLGKDSTLERVKKFEVKYPGAMEEYEEMILNENKIEYVEKRVAIPATLSENAEEAGIDFSKVLIDALEKQLKQIASKVKKNKEKKEKK